MTPAERLAAALHPPGTNLSACECGVAMLAADPDLAADIDTGRAVRETGSAYDTGFQRGYAYGANDSGLAAARADADRLAEALRAMQAGFGSLLWLGNNVENHATTTFREMFEAALADWRQGYASLNAALAAHDEAQR